MLFLAFAHRMPPKGRIPATNIDAALAAKAYFTEGKLPDDWTCEKNRILDRRLMTHHEVRVMPLQPLAEREVRLGGIPHPVPDGGSGGRSL